MGPYPEATDCSALRWKRVRHNRSSSWNLSGLDCYDSPNKIHRRLRLNLPTLTEISISGSLARGRRLSVIRKRYLQRSETIGRVLKIFFILHSPEQNMNGIVQFLPNACFRYIQTLLHVTADFEIRRSIIRHLEYGTRRLMSACCEKRERGSTRLRF